MSANPQTLTISPSDALLRTDRGARLLDIRESHERETGMARPAAGVAQAELLANPQRWIENSASETLLICASGRRSQLAADALRAMGFSHVRSVDGGTQRWRGEALPMTDGGESTDFMERYSRHLLLTDVGLAGQRKLRDARIALIGAGGLGSPAALYLAAAGVGQITLIDDDRVERSNLQRQVLHGDADIGRLKVDSGRDALLARNPSINVICVPERLQAGSAERLLHQQDVIIDGSDNFDTRYLVNACCVRLGLPMVYGAVERFTGHVAVFWPHQKGLRGSCYRCLFPDPPPAHLAPNCAEAGVLGVLPGLIGMLQATEAIKLVLKLGEPLVDTLLRVDALSMRFNRVRLTRDPECGSCGDGERSELLPVGNACAF